MLTNWNNASYCVVERGEIEESKQVLFLNDAINYSDLAPDTCYSYYIFNINDIYKYRGGTPEDLPKLVGDKIIRYTAQYFPIDIDAADLDEGFKKLIWLLDTLKLMGVDVNLIYIFFSGKKGFHVNIPSQHFGGFEPSNHLNNTFKDIFYNFKFPEGFADKRIYARRKATRCPNVQHSGSGLYKIQLTLSDIDLGIEHIKKLAENPRDTWEIKTSLIEASDNLISLKQPYTYPRGESGEKGHSGASNKAKKRIKKAKILKKGKPLFQRNENLKDYLVVLREQGHYDYTYLFEKSVEYGINCTPPMTYSEIKKTVLSIGGYIWDYDDNALRQHIAEGNAYLQQLRTLSLRHTYLWLILNANRQVDNFYKGVPVAIGEVVVGQERTAERINRGLVKKDRVSPRGLHKQFEKFEYDKAINIRVIKKGNSPQFSIITHNFFDILNYIKIKGKK